MIEIELSQLRMDDVGSRVLVLHDGGTIEGTLDSAWSRWNQYAKPPAPQGRLVIHEGNTEVEIQKLPMDFRLQIERDPKPHDSETGACQ